MNPKITFLVVVGLILMAGCINLPKAVEKPKEHAEGIIEQVGEAGEELVQDVEGKITEITLGSALASGLSYECDAEVDGSRAHYWIKKDRYRAEVQQGDVSFVVIMKDNKMYTKAMNVESPMEGCDWVMVDLSQMEGETAEEYTDSETEVDLSSPDVELNCRPSNFGDDVFSVDGQVCDITSLTHHPEPETPSSGGGGQGIGPEECNGLSGEAMIECLEKYMNEMG